jgi:rubrerythrin
VGFVVPYGRCFLCGGEDQVVEGHQVNEPGLTAIVKEAVQYELDMYHFYRIAMQRTTDQGLRAILEELYRKEEDHLAELEEKYHAHLDPDLLTPTGTQNEVMANWLFEGMSFEEKDHPLQIYDKAIALERRTRDYFKANAEELPPGPQREIYRELAAEEEEHIALLETERAQFENEK